MEVQDYMKDLFDWQKSMKKKTKSTKPSPSLTGGAVPETESESSASSSGAVPGPRGRVASGTISEAPASLQVPAVIPKDVPSTSSAHAATPAMRQAKGGKKERKTAASENNGTAAGHTHSAYSKWDRFDVDAALASDESDRDIQEGSSDEEGAAVPPVPSSPAVEAPTTSTSLGILTKEAADLTAGEIMTERSTTRTGPPSDLPPQSQEVTAASRPLPPIRSTEPQTADAWRSRGNDLFKIGQWASASECYGRGLELIKASMTTGTSPSTLAALPSAEAGLSVVMLSNRAMANLKLEKWAEAESDCTQALKIDSSHAKSLHRRGLARRQLGQTLNAACDFDLAARLEPPPPSYSISASSISTPATYTGPSAASLAERDACLAEVMEAESLKEPFPSAGGGAKTTYSNKISVAVSIINGGAVFASTSGSPLETAAPGNALTAAKVSTDSSSQSGVPSVATTAAPALKASAERLMAAAAAASEAAAAASRACLMRPPKTSTEFEASWRSFAGDSSLQASYLNLLVPEELPSVFKSTLTPQVLSGMVKTILQGATNWSPPQRNNTNGATDILPSSSEGESGKVVVAPGHADKLLQALTKVARFEMTAMSVPAKERSTLGELWDQASASAAAALQGEGQGGAFADSSLRKKFRL